MDKQNFGNLDASDTRRFMLTGLITAILINLPFYNWLYTKNWNWAEDFPLGWLGTGLIYMATFFHEIGHTVFAWFYGYATVPTFDFQHGGGMAWSFGDQQILIIGLVYALIFYGLHHLRGHVILCAGLLLFFIFHLLTAYNDLHRSVIDFMGPAFEPLIASFFLYRALFDLAPRGGLERFLNALFGFALIFRALIDAYALLYNNAYRLVYYEQKGTHGFGDFDKIADRLVFLNFETVILIWIVLATLCLLIPYGLYWSRSR